MSKTILDVIPEEIQQQWDQEDYKILCPESLEDPAVVKVVLINTNETEIEVDLHLTAAS